MLSLVILQICAKYEVESHGVDEERFSTMRCYAENGYTCAKSYFMPCTPNYDEEGNVIPGEEMSCPENFRLVDLSISSLVSQHIMYVPLIR